jgi:hypothetical protein
VYASFGKTWTWSNSREAKETCVPGKRDLFTRQERPVYRQKRPVWRNIGKIDLYTRQKRPIYNAKETCVEEHRQKRPMYKAKETSNGQ